MNSQQAPALLLQAVAKKALRAVGQAIEIVPRMATGARRQVALMEHTQSAELFMQAIVAAIPDVIVRIDAKEDVGRRVVRRHPPR